MSWFVVIWFQMSVNMYGLKTTYYYCLVIVVVVAAVHSGGSGDVFFLINGELIKKSYITPGKIF